MDIAAAPLNFIGRMLEKMAGRPSEFLPINGQDFFIYSFLFTSLAGATSATQNVNIQADSNFLLDGISYFADIAAAVQTDSTRVIPLVTVQFTDTGSGRNLQDNPIALPGIAGHEGEPFMLKAPRIFMSKATLQCQAVNLTAATTYNLRIFLIGRKVFG